MPEAIKVVEIATILIKFMGVSLWLLIAIVSLFYIVREITRG